MWKVERVSWQEEVSRKQYLVNGWEPFAVTTNQVTGADRIYMRKAFTDGMPLGWKSMPRSIIDKLQAQHEGMAAPSDSAQPIYIEPAEWDTYTMFAGEPVCTWQEHKILQGSFDDQRGVWVPTPSEC